MHNGIGHDDQDSDEKWVLRLKMEKQISKNFYWEIASAKSSKENIGPHIYLKLLQWNHQQYNARPC